MGTLSRKQIFFAGLEFKWLDDFAIVRYFSGLVKGFSGMAFCENFERRKQSFVLISVKWDKFLLMWRGLMNSLRLYNCQMSCIHLKTEENRRRAHPFSLLFMVSYTLSPMRSPSIHSCGNRKGHLNKISLARLIIVCCTLQPSSTVWIHLSGTKPLLNAETMYSVLCYSITTRVLSLSL